MPLSVKAREFAEAVRKTREFMELKQALADIDGKPGLKKTVEEFKRKQMETFTMNQPGSKAAELTEEFKRLSGIAEVMRYMAAGKKFNDMMLGTFKMINDYIELELKSR